MKTKLIPIFSLLLLFVSQTAMTKQTVDKFFYNETSSDISVKLELYRPDRTQPDQTQPDRTPPGVPGGKNGQTTLVLDHTLTGIVKPGSSTENLLKLSYDDSLQPVLTVSSASYNVNIEKAGACTTTRFYIYNSMFGGTWIKGVCV